MEFGACPRADISLLNTKLAVAAGIGSSIATAVLLPVGRVGGQGPGWPPDSSLYQNRVVCCLKNKCCYCPYA